MGNGSVYRMCSSEIYVVNNDGTNQVRITDTTGRNMSPAW